MCVMSMVHDHFAPLIPDLTMPWNVPQVPIRVAPPWDAQPAVAPFGETIQWPPPPAQVIDYARLADEFRKACEAARVIDAITGKPDCVDPAKEPLQARVAELERRLASLEAAQKPVTKVRRKTAKRVAAT